MVGDYSHVRGHRRIAHRRAGKVPWIGPILAFGNYYPGGTQTLSGQRGVEVCDEVVELRARPLTGFVCVHVRIRLVLYGERVQIDTLAFHAGDVIGELAGV